MNLAYITFTIAFMVWIAVELWLFLRDRRIKPSGGNKGGRVLYSLPAVAVIICVLLRYVNLPFGRISMTEGLLTGTVVIWAGLFLRWWSIRTLGRYFHTVVTIQDKQRVIEKGPYKYIRHPSYLGSLVICTGVGLGFGNWIGFVVVLILPFIAFNLRIYVEEEIMTSTFGYEYLHYISRTNKLIPFLY